MSRNELGAYSTGGIRACYSAVTYRYCIFQGEPQTKGDNWARLVELLEELSPGVAEIIFHASDPTEECLSSPGRAKPSESMCRP